ncbi:hypothetical protein B5722_05895 [Escherichia coli]|nr:hypothetical protein [Escherichia coli]MGK17103.1 hypothetical protein [Escherichia coli]
MKRQKNRIFGLYDVVCFWWLILIKTNSYAREVPTCFFLKNFHKQLRIARTRTPGVSDSGKDP